jgi:hypothetical protein
MQDSFKYFKEETEKQAIIFCWHQKIALNKDIQVIILLFVVKFVILNIRIKGKYFLLK